jgi:hypothetical protein
VPDGVQFFVGSVLERDQSAVRAGYGQEDLVELALGRALMAGLGGFALTHGRRVRTPAGRVAAAQAGVPLAQKGAAQVERGDGATV